MFQWFRIRSRKVRFCEFVFDPESLQLSRKDKKVALGKMPLTVLGELIAGAGRTISRQSLKSTLWPGCERIDTERRLNTTIRALRKSLMEDADSPQFIETVRGDGYRWIGPIENRFPKRLKIAAATLIICCFAAATITRFPSYGGQIEAVPQHHLTVDLNRLDTAQLKTIVEELAIAEGFDPADAKARIRVKSAERN